MWVGALEGEACVVSDGAGEDGKVNAVQGDFVVPEHVSEALGEWCCVSAVALFLGSAVRAGRGELELFVAEPLR